MYDRTINAFDLAERYRVPVFLLSEKAIAHLGEKAKIDKETGLFGHAKRGLHLWYRAR
jgi:pyruvate/2-oxoacid:ferredoxin oxidoreductase alpha subunit